MTTRAPTAAAAKTCHLDDKHPGKLRWMMDAVLSRKTVKLLRGGRKSKSKIVEKKRKKGVVEEEKRLSVFYCLCFAT